MSPTKQREASDRVTGPVSSAGPRSRCVAEPLRALAAVCPHRGGPLADGLIDDCVVVCPLHGRTYDLFTGAEVTVGGDAVRAYHVTSDPEGTIEIDTHMAVQ